jgi:Domain of unknown function (DUF4382)
MSIHRPRLVSLISTGALAALAAACGAQKTSGTPAPTGFGQFAVRLVDAPPDKTSDVVQLWVSITKVTAHATPGGWTTIVKMDKPLSVNLLDLQTSALDLGLANLPKGTVEQVRLYVSPEEGANYVVLKGDLQTHVPLKVPSGAQSGIKVHGPWDVAECSQTAVTLDFDGKRSIWYHPTGNGDEWILRPVIRVKKSESVPVGCVPDGGAGTTPRTCQADGDCNQGELCVEHTCAGGEGAACTGASECFSGTCVSGVRCGPGSAGEPCLNDTDCITGTCSQLKCAQGGGSAPCANDTDCVSGKCSDSTCTPPPGSVPEGGGCLLDNECQSGECLNGLCGTSGQGNPCGEGQTCAGDLVCTEGSCESVRAN